MVVFLNLVLVLNLLTISHFGDYAHTFGDNQIFGTGTEFADNQDFGDYTQTFGDRHLVLVQFADNQDFGDYAQTFGAGHDIWYWY